MVLYCQATYHPPQTAGIFLTFSHSLPGCSKSDCAVLLVLCAGSAQSCLAATSAVCECLKRQPWADQVVWHCLQWPRHWSRAWQTRTRLRAASALTTL